MELIDKKQFDLVNEFYISLKKNFDDLLEENKKLHDDRSKLLGQGLSLKDENLKLKEQNLSLKKTLEHTDWATKTRFEIIENILYDYNLSKKDIDEIIDKIIEQHNF